MTEPPPVETLRRIDCHCHVGLRGDTFGHWGHISDRMREDRPKYDVFLLYVGVERGQDLDLAIMERTLETLSGTSLERVVCLALDHVWDQDGRDRRDLSDFWVANEYVRFLQSQLPQKILFGASVHPFRADFKDRVSEYVDKGAVCLKWLPSSQQFSLDHPIVRERMKWLATARGGRALPLLLHVGVEYAVPTADERLRPYDYLSWGLGDRLRNWLRRRKWIEPKIVEVRRSIDESLRAGGIIILAHVGLPYFVARANLIEHDDFPIVREYLINSAAGKFGAGKCYADLSACATPFRRHYFDRIKKLPKNHLLFGSDWPTPVFELSADLHEAKRDFRAMLQGDFWRIAVPQGNRIDVNLRELNHVFPGHPMFTNFDRFFCSRADIAPPANA